MLKKNESKQTKRAKSKAKAVSKTRSMNCKLDEACQKLKEISQEADKVLLKYEQKATSQGD